MIMKKIYKLCRDAGVIHLYESEDRAVQWIGDGSAFYPLHGIRPMDAQTARNTADIPRKDCDGFRVEITPFPEALCFDDSDPRENPIDEFCFNLEPVGGTEQPIRTQQGLVLLDPCYLDPIDVPVTLYERITDGGMPYIAAKMGMDLMGIILPRFPRSKRMAKHLREVADLYGDAYEEYELMEAQRKAQGNGEVEGDA